MKYLLANPTGNITALVLSCVRQEEQCAAALKLMQEEPSAEQVGFISEGKKGTDASLRMAGGEFCANATMSAAALCALREQLKTGEEKTFLIRASGMKNAVEVSVQPLGERTFLCTEKLASPESIETVFLESGVIAGEFPLVHFAGISHVICEKNIPPAEAETAVKKWCRELGTDALGIMLLNRDKKSMKPLVYVAKGETLFWENSCGSGSSAVGAFVAQQENAETAISLLQPGGTLSVRCSPGGEISLTGKVILENEKNLALHELPQIVRTAQKAPPCRDIKF